MYLFINALFISAVVTRCLYRYKAEPPKSKQCRCRRTVARKKINRKKPREEPGSEWWPVLFWLCRVEILRLHGH